MVNIPFIQLILILNFKLVLSLVFVQFKQYLIMVVLLQEINKHI